jgi:hypothetical protein
MLASAFGMWCLMSFEHRVGGDGGRRHVRGADGPGVTRMATLNYVVCMVGVWILCVSVSVGSELEKMSCWATNMLALVF